MRTKELLIRAKEALSIARASNTDRYFLYSDIIEDIDTYLDTQETELDYEVPIMRHLTGQTKVLWPDKLENARANFGEPINRQDIAVYLGDKPICNFVQREGRCDGMVWDECTICGSTYKNLCKLKLRTGKAELENQGVK